MHKWNADFINDPSNDYELTVEILYGDQDIGIIKKGSGGLELILFPQSENVIIPFDWLFRLMKEVEVSILK
jgi:hypothetical protein